MQSYWALLLSLLVHWDKGFSLKTSSFSNLGTKGSFTIASQIPLSIYSTKFFILTFQNWYFGLENKGGMFIEAPSPNGSFLAILEKVLA